MNIDAILQKRVACYHVTDQDVGKIGLVVSGWVYHSRDQGGILFIDLRDRSGQLQIVFNKSEDRDLFEQAENLGLEYVIMVRGDIMKRSKDTINTKLQTGTIEMIARELIILNESDIVPIPIDEFGSNINEENRLKYRYLYLRHSSMQNMIRNRHIFITSLRDSLNKQDFLEIETPILNKATPEGARDFLVPSRLNKNNFYALPQSPQIFKQILMMAQMEKYYQIARCFRDEDLRKDRQPEFTQLDIEMSFVTRDQLIDLLENILVTTCKEAFGVDLHNQIIRMSYHDAMEKYGTDKPDLRFGLTLTNLDTWASKTSFQVFNQALQKNNRVFCLSVPSGASLSRKDIDNLTETVGRECNAKGLAWIKHTENGLESFLMKFIPEQAQAELLELTGSKPGGIIFFGADTEEIVFLTLSTVRTLMAEHFNLIPSNTWKASWITDFPLFYWNHTENRLDSMHNPFTAPVDSDLEFLRSLQNTNLKDIDPSLIKQLSQLQSKAYDICLNGVEIGGGSIRIHNSSLQHLVFCLLNLSEEQIQEQFGFFLQALRFGAPPHGGIAFGLDRILMLFNNMASIRDVIAFPKTQKGQCLMSQSPSKVKLHQLLDLSIKTITS